MKKVKNHFVDYLSFLFDEYVKDRLSIGRQFLYHFGFDCKMMGVEGHTKQLYKAVNMCNYIYSHFETDDEIYDSFEIEYISRNIGYILDSIRLNNQILEKLGLLDILDSHYEKIINNLDFKYIPAYDQQIMFELGSRNPKRDLKGLIFLLKQNLKVKRFNNDSINRSTRKILNNSYEKVESEWKEFREFIEKKKNDKPKHNRKWFKGLGQIGQGVALSIGNICLATDLINVPVSPETKTWGSIVSCTTGVGMIMNGIGDLRDE